MNFKKFAFCLLAFAMSASSFAGVTLSDLKGSTDLHNPMATRSAVLNTIEFDGKGGLVIWFSSNDYAEGRYTVQDLKPYNDTQLLTMTWDEPRANGKTERVVAHMELINVTPQDLKTGYTQYIHFSHGEFVLNYIRLK